MLIGTRSVVNFLKKYDKENTEKRKGTMLHIFCSENSCVQDPQNNLGLSCNVEITIRASVKDCLEIIDVLATELYAGLPKDIDIKVSGENNVWAMYNSLEKLIKDEVVK